MLTLITALGLHCSAILKRFELPSGDVTVMAPDGPEDDTVAESMQVLAACSADVNAVDALVIKG